MVTEGFVWEEEPTVVIMGFTVLFTSISTAQYRKGYNQTTYVETARAPTRNT